MFPEDEAKGLVEGKKYTVSFSHDWFGSVSMTAEHISDKEDGKVAVLFSARTKLADTTLLRVQTVDIVTRRLEGIRVPRQALRVVTETVTDKETGLETEVQRTGVYTVVGTQAEFQEVSVLYTDDNFYLVEPIDSSAARRLRAGDDGHRQLHRHLRWEGGPMSGIAENLARARENIQRAAMAAGRDPEKVTLVAATKTQSDDTIRQAIAAGVTVCGENRVQELTAHLAANAYEGAAVHFIGHLQTNKVKYVVGHAALIHSVSSKKLLLAIDKQAEKLGICQDILLEVNLAGEESKSGFAPEEALPAARLAAELEHVRLRGLMCIPPAAEKSGENRPFFAKLRRLAVDISLEMGDNKADNRMAVHGNERRLRRTPWPRARTFVRLGTALFGPRPSAPSRSGTPLTERGQSI